MRPGQGQRFASVEVPNQSTPFARQNQVELRLSLPIVFSGSVLLVGQCPRLPASSVGAPVHFEPGKDRVGASELRFSPGDQLRKDGGGMGNQMGGTLHVCRLHLLSGQ
jgi:hypothetical protein